MDDVGNFFKGAGRTVSYAVQTVGQALGSAVGSIATGLTHIVGAIATWTVDQTKNLVHSLLHLG